MRNDPLPMLVNYENELEQLRSACAPSVPVAAPLRSYLRL